MMTGRVVKADMFFSLYQKISGNCSAYVVIASAFCEAIPNPRIGDCFVGKNRLLAMTA